MPIVDYTNKPTSSFGKDAATTWSKANCKFYPDHGSKSLILIGSEEGAPRHFKDEQDKGFNADQVIVADNIKSTADSLELLIQTHPQFDGATVIHDDIVNVFDRYPPGTITHIDFDTAAGWRESIDSTNYFIQKAVPTILYTWTERCGLTMEKVWPRHKGGWRNNVRQRDGSHKDMPPLQRDVVKLMLEESPNGHLYDIVYHPYTGVGSGKNQTGGTPMVMFLLNLK